MELILNFFSFYGEALQGKHDAVDYIVFLFWSALIAEYFLKGGLKKDLVTDVFGMGLFVVVFVSLSSIGYFASVVSFASLIFMVQFAIKKFDPERREKLKNIEDKKLKKEKRKKAEEEVINEELKKREENLKFTKTLNDLKEFCVKEWNKIYTDQNPIRTEIKKTRDLLEFIIKENYVVSKKSNRMLNGYLPEIMNSYSESSKSDREDNSFLEALRNINEFVYDELETTQGSKDENLHNLKDLLEKIT